LRGLIVPLVVAVALAALASGTWVSPARADGDPASDVLVSQLLFLPQDAGLTVREQTEMGALLSAARRSGYQLRVAIIATPIDLGSITELWHQPASYARFLGQELSLVYRGTLLVVMPNGFGLYGPGAALAAQRHALVQRPSGAGSTLGAVTISAVRRLAAAAGHPLQVSAISSPAAPTPTDYGALIALAAGALLVALAWTVSLRVRPLGSHPGSTQ
jgi:hypothetical protein